MIKLDMEYEILSNTHSYISEKSESNKVIVFERGDLLFIFNFHPSQVNKKELTYS